MRILILTCIALAMTLGAAAAPTSAETNPPDLPVVVTNAPDAGGAASLPAAPAAWQDTIKTWAATLTGVLTALAGAVAFLLSKWQDLKKLIADAHARLDQHDEALGTPSVVPPTSGNGGLRLLVLGAVLASALALGACTYSGTLSYTDPQTGATVGASVGGDGKDIVRGLRDLRGLKK